MTQIVARTETHLVCRDLVKRLPSGRDWGNKLPETRKGEIIQNDAWEGPCVAGERGEYHRCTWREYKVEIDA
jgi:hypothetical protein